MLQIKIENFEGPLDLLLKLTEKQEMDITKISLAKIADQYIEHIKNFKDIRPEEIGDFLVIAAKLLFIKSKILLPAFEWEEEEDGEELEQQLKIYKEFLEANQKIEKLIKKKRFSYLPQINSKNYKSRALLSQANVFFPPKKIKADDLSLVFKQVIRELKQTEIIKGRLQEKKLSYRVTLEERIDALRVLVGKKIKLSFDKIISNSKDKTEIIVNFLAILELSKQKVIITEQEDLFTCININSYSNSKNSFKDN